MKAEGRGVAMYVGIVLLFLLLFTHEAVFDIMNEVLFTGTNAAVNQGNVTGGWAEVGVTVLWFAVLIFLGLGVVYLLAGRGETG